MNIQIEILNHLEKLLKTYKDMLCTSKLTEKEFENIVSLLEGYIKETKKITKLA